MAAPGIAGATECHFAEDFLLPVSKDIDQGMTGGRFVTHLSAIFLSNDTVCRRIDDMPAETLDRITQEIKCVPLPVFSIQLDECTDMVHCLSTVIGLLGGILMMATLKMKDECL